MIYERQDAWTHDVVIQQQVVAVEFIIAIKSACNHNAIIHVLNLTVI